jgi:hypothetical protein
MYPDKTLDRAIQYPLVGRLLDRPVKPGDDSIAFVYLIEKYSNCPE